MYKSIIINCNIATMDSKIDAEYGIIKDGAIIIDEDEIIWVGKKSELPEAPEETATTIHDLDGKWISPGLIDCHTHLIYAGNRANEFEQRLNGASYEEISKQGGGIISTVNNTRKASKEDLFKSAMKRMVSMIKSGVTGFEIKSGYGLDTETEAKMLSVATNLRDNMGVKLQRSFLGAHAIPPEYKDRPDEYIDLICNEMIPYLFANNLIDAIDAFGENIAFTPEQVRRVFDKAKEFNIPIKLHADQLSNQKGGKLAAEYQALSAEHLEYVDEESLIAMKLAGTVATILPAAYYFLRETKQPPIDKFREHGINMAIASDCNPGSSPITSPLLVMNMACILFKMTPLEALQGMTTNAAQALGWQNELGSIKKQMRADLAIWDISDLSELSYNIGHNPCAGVFVAGDSFNFA